MAQWLFRYFYAVDCNTILAAPVDDAWTVLVTQDNGMPSADVLSIELNIVLPGSTYGQLLLE